MTEPQAQMPNGQPVAVATRPGDPAEPSVEETLDGGIATTGTVQESLQTGLAATAGVVREWADGLAGLPFSALTRGDVDPISLNRSWLDGTFELIDVWWTVHRRSVDHLLALQRRAAAQMLDSGRALSEMNRALARRPGSAEPRTTPPTPR